MKEAKAAAAADKADKDAAAASKAAVAALLQLKAELAKAEVRCVGCRQADCGRFV